MRLIPFPARFHTILIVAGIILLPTRTFAQTTESLHSLWRYGTISWTSAHAFSHSGKLIAFVEYPQIKIWDLSTGSFIHAISIPPRAWDQIAFTQNDNEIVLVKSSSQYYGYREESILHPAILRITIASEKYNLIEMASQGNQGNDKFSLSPDGERIARLSANTLSIIDSRSSAILDSTPLPLQHASWPNQVDISFSDHGKKIVVFWYGQEWEYSVNSLRRAILLGDSLRWNPSIASVDGVFLSHFYKHNDGLMIDAHSNHPAELQPPLLFISATDKNKGEESVAENATLFGNGEYLASRYALWRGMVIDYGTPPGDDSVVFTSLYDRSMRWGLRMSNEMIVLGTLPLRPYSLVFSDKRSVIIVDARTQKVTHLIHDIEQIVGFTEHDLFLVRGQSEVLAFAPDKDSIMWTQEGLSNSDIHLSTNRDHFAQVTNDRDIAFYDQSGRTLGVFYHVDRGEYIAAYLPNDVLLLKKDYDQGCTLYTTASGSKGEPALDPFLRFIPYDTNTLFAYSNFWSHGDSAILYDYVRDTIIQSYPGGLNSSISAAAISRDKKWAVTIAPGGGGKLWRISDGALKMCFELEDRTTPRDIQFSPNGRYLLYFNDSMFLSRDLIADRTSVVLRDYGNFTFNHNDSKLAIYSKLSGLSMYNVPLVWRRADTVLDPKQVFLPLRFYLPANAPDALDTNGKPFSPPRTHVELEVRDANGHLVQKILDGAFHKGKWHLWEWEATKHPKGTYIMHTEIGGVVKDEAMEVK